MTARFFVVFRVPRRKVPVNSMQQGSSGVAGVVKIQGSINATHFGGDRTGCKCMVILKEFLPYNSALFGFLECLHNMFLIGCKCLTAFLNSS